MKRWQVILVLVLTAGVGMASELFSRPDRSATIGKDIVARAEAGNTEIVVEKAAPRTVLFAARELKSFLDAILGGDIPVVNEQGKDRVSFVLGATARAKAAGLKTETLVRDAYIIQTVGDDVYIAGLDDPKANPDFAINRGGVWSQHYERATLFGVYEFLERFCGVRMYFPGELGTVIPRVRSLSIPSIRLYDRPDFLIRHVSTFWDGLYFEGEKRGATLHPQKTLNSYYRLRLETEYIPCCHGTNAFKYIQRFGESHPEYFALLSNGKRSNDPQLKHSGQLCWTSGILEEIYQDVRAYLKGESAESRGIPGWKKGHSWGVNCAYGKYVDIMPQDGFTGCHCPTCQAAYNKGEKDYATELMWKNTVDIAKRLKAEGIPGYITQMAYRPYRRIPDMDIPDNVLVMVAESGPWAKANPEKLAAHNQEIKDWAKKLGHKVWIWTYVNKGASTKMPGVPQMSPHAYGEYYQGISPWIFGAFAESESDRFLYNYLNYYVFAKVAWNNQVDWRQLLQEHYDLMYGKASADMKAYYELLEKNWVERIAGRTVDTELGPVGAPPSDYDLWNNIYAPDMLKTLDGMLTRATEKVGENSLEGKRIALVRREFQQPLEQAAEDYGKATQAIRGLVWRIADKPGDPLHLCPFGKVRKDEELVSTKVQVWKTTTDLALRFTCAEPDMDKMMAVKRKADEREIWKDNSVEMFLNPTGDRKNYYQIMVNSEGSVSDQKLLKLGATGKGDFAWNSQVKVKIEKGADSWSMEALIPLSSLPGMIEEFPVNFTRNRVLDSVKPAHVLYHLSPFARGFHDLENFGRITTAPDGNILMNHDYTIPALRDKRFWGVWQGSKWLGGWFGGHKKLEQRDTDIYVSAPASMRLTDGGIICQYLPTLKPNAKYRLTYYVKLKDVKPTKAGGGVGANLWDDRNRWFPAHNWLTGTTDWLFQSIDLVTGKNTNKKNRSYLRLSMLNATGQAWVDKVRLEELK